MAESVTVVASGGVLVTESLDNTGVPLTPTSGARPVTIGSGGPEVTFISANGVLLPGGVDAAILLSASTLAENSAENTAIGTLSVFGATGTASFTLVDSSSNKVKLAGANNVNVQAGSSAVNYETTPTFNFTVSVSGVTPSISNATFAVTVTDVNEASPVITSNGGGASASVSVAENTTAVTTVTATDADGTAVITYSISGGADAAKFQIGSSSGVLTFVSAPDYEAPTDLGDTAGNNTYVVIVQASDGTNTDTQTITVTVTDAGEGGGGTTGEPMGLLLSLTYAA
jgi:hypothetical protein